MPQGGVTTEKLADGAVTPEKRSGGFKIGIIPASTFGTTGSKAITGVGFKPKLVRFTVLPPSSITALNLGIGAMTETSQYTTAVGANHGGSGTARYSSTTSAIAWIDSANGTLSMEAKYVSMDSDGFTINVTSANGAYPVAYEAYA